MVESTLMSVQRRHGSLIATGDVDRADTFMVHSPAGKGDMYGGAAAGSRRMPVKEALDYEAAALGDAELDTRSPGHGYGQFRVFGNATFEREREEAEAASSSPRVGTPGHTKMNNLFGSPAAPQRGTPDQKSRLRSSIDHDGTPEKPGRALGRLFQATGNGGSGTMVEAFDARAVEDEEEAQTRIVARARPASSLAATTSTAAWEQELRVMMADGRREQAVQRAAPSQGLIKCHVKRVKNFFGTHCSFQMHLDSADTFLLAARRRKKSKVSSYVLSLDLEDLKRDTPNCMAKLKANFVGTEYMLWGKSDDKRVKKGYAREQLCINYKTTLSVAGGPRQMYVTMPLPEEEWQPVAPDGSDSLSNVLELARLKELAPSIEKKMAMLTTKPPEWDENLNAFTLDFKGRVKEASVKNFQLVAWDHNTDRKGGDVVLQFGKVSDDVYALDFAYPMTAEVAFAIALASIDTKLCYTL